MLGFSLLNDGFCIRKTLMKFTKDVSFLVILKKMFKIRLFIIISLLFAIAYSQNHDYDVIVVGSEPEGIMAAIAAAENGAKTLLISQDSLVGGLYVMGQMNSLDLRQEPFNYQQGLFAKWWHRVGNGHSFDISLAETAFTQMLAEAGVLVRTSAPELSPFVEDGIVKGVRVAASKQYLAGTIFAKQIIDATSEMDFAAAAGAKYSIGFADIGLNERMVDTLVFRIDNVDWAELKRGIKRRGKNYASVDDWVAWGHFDKYPANYQAVEKGIRLRGLNLGRQADGSVLVNALLIYGIDPFDPESIKDGFARAEREAPRIIDYLKLEIPGFRNASYGGVAKKLYIRESRHLDAECKLTIDDVVENKVSQYDIATGGYPLDVQTLTPFDSGFVYGKPEIYGVQLCVNVPKGLENLWVVGKTAGYDPLAASSARVVPFGMAIAEAVGLAAAEAAKNNLSSHEYIADKNNILALRSLLLARGAVLPSLPLGPSSHPYYADYRTMLSRGLAVAGYNNEPYLDQEMKALSYVYLLANVAERFLKDDEFGQIIVDEFGALDEPLSEQRALQITVFMLCKLGDCLEPSWSNLINNGYAPDSFPPKHALTRGEMYALAARIARKFAK